MRIIQLSDCHVSALPQAHYRGCDAVGGLASIVGVCREWQPDVVVASGDLSEDGSAESYRLLADCLSQAGPAVYLLPGNHDDMDLMREGFVENPFYLVEDCAIAPWRLYFLDTTIPGNPAGRVDNARAIRLAEKINGQTEPHALIFMHHQPWLSGSAWIDKYGLMQAENFREALSGCNKLRAVAWGHVHHGWELKKDGVSWLGCPSTVSNTLPYSEKFTFDDRGPACRWLKLTETGEINTGLLYAES